MNFLTKYFRNTSTYQCRECKHIWTQNVVQWFCTIVHFDITRHRYVKCPRCGARHWLQAKEVVK